MNDPWFGPNDLAGVLIGPILGSLAIVWGLTCRVLVPRGQGKAVIWASYIVLLLSAIGCVAVGAYADQAANQPFHVSYSFTLVGMILTPLLATFGFLLRYSYRQANSAARSQANE